ncbi:MAG: hypothetical protein IKM59_04980 [Oscillospiraceae bacterium]|nr:hypothetical protein [Oscillospiraceae bacterium]
MNHYRIGNMDILVDPGPMIIEETMLTAPFLCSETVGPEALEIFVAEKDLSFLRDWEKEIYTGAYELRKGPEGQHFLLQHWKTHRYAFGLYLEELEGDGPIHIYCNTGLGEPLCISAAFLLGAAGIHHRLLRRKHGVLHASYVTWEGKGILFAAPSQVGKSTQADLWCRYAGARLCNGDRALLFRQDGLWHAGGYIACGSSECCRNENAPLAAIVLLEQGKENLLRPATEKDRIRAFFAGFETYHWSTVDMDLALALGKELAAEAPVLHFSCRPDRDAVQTLKTYLEGGSTC